MRDACEALRVMDGDGMSVGDVDAARAGGGGKDVGRLYRIAMMKNDIWKGVPIEYARIQTDGPPRNGWDHDWKR